MSAMSAGFRSAARFATTGLVGPDQGVGSPDADVGPGARIAGGTGYLDVRSFSGQSRDHVGLTAEGDLLSLHRVDGHAQLGALHLEADTRDNDLVQAERIGGQVEVKDDGTRRESDGLGGAGIAD